MFHKSNIEYTSHGIQRHFENYWRAILCEFTKRWVSEQLSFPFRACELEELVEYALNLLDETRTKTDTRFNRISRAVEGAVRATRDIRDIQRGFAEVQTHYALSIDQSRAVQNLRSENHHDPVLFSIEIICRYFPEERKLIFLKLFQKAMMNDGKLIVLPKNNG